MSENYDSLAGVDPTTNPRFKLLPNGQYSEQLANQVQLFWDPVTQEGRAIFNSQPYLNLGGVYTGLQGVMDVLLIDFINRLGTCYGKGLVDPVTGKPLDDVSVAGVSILMSAAFDIEFAERAAALAAAAAGSGGTGGDSGTGTGDDGSGSGDASSGSGDMSSGESSSGDSPSGSS